MLRRSCVLAVLAVVLGLVVSSRAEDTNLLASLKKGTVELKSAGPLAFGPQGILFIGDPVAASIHAIDTGDRTASASKDRPKVEGINDKVASLLGTEASDIQIKDLAVNPVSGTTWLSVARGKGPSAAAVVVRLTRDNKLSEFSLKNVPTATATIPNAAEGKGRQEAITHLAYLKGRVFVAGLSNEEFSSKLRAIPFPFQTTDKGTSIEIFHGAHGRFETKSPVRVFAPYQIKGEDHLLAAYTCTPLVKIPVSSLKPGEKIMGSTVAELGNMNRPLSMIVYQKDGKDYVLMANSARGLMKIKLEGVDTVANITKPVRGGGTAGLTYDKITDIKGVQKLDAFDSTHAVVLLSGSGGKINLETIDLP
jgi:hypothetical protein